MTLTMTRPTNRLTLIEPTRYLSADGLTPHLKPLVGCYRYAPTEARPEAVWARYWALDKTSLMVTATLDRPNLPAGAHHLDAILSAAQLRGAEAAWDFAGDEARVIPLPLALLNVVEIDETPRKKKVWPNLPLWASTPLIQERPGQAQALCIGHEDTVRELLSYIHTIGKDEALVGVKWQVAPLPISDSEARDIITEQRPMPDTAPRWTPPYWYDWTARQTEKS